jgi:S1-C subfamily serine protease
MALNGYHATNRVEQSAPPLPTLTPPSTSQTYQIPLSSVLRLRCDDGMGTGAIIGPRDAVTAAHVVGDSEYCLVLSEAGEPLVRANIVERDAKLDYARLSLDLEDEVPEDYIIPFRCEPMRNSSLYMAIGYAHGNVFVLQMGRASNTYYRVSTTDGNSFHHLRKLVGTVPGRAAVQKGMSGGPVVNQYGELVGTVIARPRPSDNPNFFSREIADTPLCKVRR